MSLLARLPATCYTRCRRWILLCSLSPETDSRAVIGLRTTASITSRRHFLIICFPLFFLSFVVAPERGSGIQAWRLSIRRPFVNHQLPSPPHPASVHREPKHTYTHTFTAIPIDQTSLLASHHLSIAFPVIPLDPADRDLAS